MSDSSAAFLEAIRAAPDDDAPRLIYADWLDEQGSPDATAQATFIRSQIALARLSPYDPERIEHEIRQEALEARFATEWRERLRPHEAVAPWFDRGLVVGFGCDVGRFARNSEALRQLCPAWRELKLYGDGSYLGEALKPAAVERLVALTVRGDKTGDAGAWAIADSPRLANLKRLAFSGQGVETSGVSQLAASPHLTKLVDLDLSENPLDARAILELARSPLGKRLERLVLNGSPEFVGAIAAAEFPNLRELSLNMTSISPADAEMLAKGPLLRSVERLKLSFCGLGDEGLARLTAGESLARCVELELAGNELGRAGMEALARCEALRGLRCLKLNRNEGIGHERGLEALAKSETLRELEALHLVRCEIQDDAVVALAASPIAQRLRLLDLSQNNVGDRGASALANAPELAELAVLQLARNSIGEAGVASLARSETLPRLHTLELSQNPLGDGVFTLTGVDPLAQPSVARRRRQPATASDSPRGLTSLHRLKLDSVLQTSRKPSVRLEKQRGDRLLDALDTNRSLTNLRELSLDGNRLTKQAGERLLRSPALPHLLRLRVTGPTLLRPES